MILSFSDLHFGLRSYSHQQESGFFDAEEDAKKSLEEILLRASKNDIEKIIIPGDITHTNKPTSLVVRHLTNWFHRLNDLNKEVYIIPGNHDDSVYSHSTAFISELKLKNIFMIDKAIDNTSNITWGDWDIVFAPYITSISGSLKDRNDEVHSLVRERVQAAKSKTIIVSHIHESSAQLGSEQIMISKGVDIVNMENYDKENLILLVGHIHRQQLYKKKNITVCYPGSPYYMDVTDAGQQKGYALITSDGSVKFEQIIGIRTFQHYRIPEEINPTQFLKGMRILKNQVMFFTMPPTSKIYEKELKEYVLSIGNFFGNVYYKSQDLEIKRNGVVIKQNDPYVIMKDNIKNTFNENNGYTNFNLTTEQAEHKLFNIMSSVFQNKEVSEE